MLRITTALLVFWVATATHAAARTTPNPQGRVILGHEAMGEPTPILEPQAPALGRAVPVDLAPGAVLLAETYYDLQDFGSLGKRIVIGSDGRVHVTYQDDLCEIAPGGCPPDLNQPQPFPERSNAYRWRAADGTWSAAVKPADPRLRGCCVTELFGGFGALALTPDGRAAVVPHLNEDGCDPRAAMYVQERFEAATFRGYLTQITEPSYLFPQLAVRPDGSFVLLAEIPQFPTYGETERFRIARLSGEGQAFVCPVGWQFGNWTEVVPNPSVFRGGEPAYPVIATAADGRVGVAVGDFGGNVFLFESADGTFATGTISVTQITDYTDAQVVDATANSDQYRSFIHCDLVYRGNEPNVVWSELQARRGGSGVFFVDYRSRIRHWNPTDGVSTVHQTAGEADSYSAVDLGGSGPLAGFNTISVDWPQVGVSDEDQSIHVAWLRFVDTEIDATANAGLPGIVTGIGYGDVVIARNTGAGSWSAPRNLTNTPNADERFVSLAANNPDGRLHLVFQASATDEAGVTAIGDRSFANVNILRRIAHLEVDAGNATDVGSRWSPFTGLSVHPNPSSGHVEFRMRGRTESSMRIRIYSVSGRNVAEISAPSDVVRWDGRAQDGQPLANGVYFARVNGDAGPITRFVIRR